MSQSLTHQMLFVCSLCCSLILIFSNALSSYDMGSLTSITMKWFFAVQFAAAWLPTYYHGLLIAVHATILHARFSLICKLLAMWNCVGANE